MEGIKYFSTVSDLQNYLGEHRKNCSVGFVPTMGALHPGHLSLVDRALQENHVVVVSIFVNPKQFNNQQDLLNYPRTLEQDLSLLGDRNVLVFSPEFSEVYPEGHSDVSMDIGELGRVMEGKFRPGHFDGVITVVSRLFDIVQPDRAYFGEKDFQQLAVIRFMVAQQNNPITIVPCPVLREESGLAMSSRNMLLTDQERRKAAGIHQIISQVHHLKGQLGPLELSNVLKEQFEKSGFDLEYLEIVHPHTLIPLSQEWVENARLCVAVHLGKVRLIDNIEIV